MRRALFAVVACLFVARALPACGDGNVTGEDPMLEDSGSSMPITDRDAGSDDWNELDGGTIKKGTPDAAPARTDGVADLARATAVRASDLPAGNDPCATRDDGTYCAGLLGLPTAGLLRCASHRSGAVTPCAAGCIDRPGATDACLDNTVDPCFDERDGLYCGRSIGATTRSDDAFRCALRRTTWTGTCAGGCQMTATGVTCSR